MPSLCGEIKELSIGDQPMRVWLKRSAAVVMLLLGAHWLWPESSDQALIRRMYDAAGGRSLGWVRKADVTELYKASKGIELVDAVSFISANASSWGESKHLDPLSFRGNVRPDREIVAYFNKRGWLNIPLLTEHRVGFSFKEGKLTHVESIVVSTVLTL